MLPKLKRYITYPDEGSFILYVMMMQHMYVARLSAMILKSAQCVAYLSKGPFILYVTVMQCAIAHQNRLVVPAR